MTRWNPTHLPEWEKESLEAIRAARERLESAAAASEQAATDLEDAIREALRQECMVGRVADAAGLTRRQLYHRYQAKAAS